MLKKEKPKKINKVLELFLHETGLKSKFVQAQIIGDWDKFVGKPVANRTKNLYIKDKVLYVTTESATVKSQLNMMKQAIVTMISSKFGAGVVTEIKIF